MLDEADRLPWWHVFIAPVSIVFAAASPSFAHWLLAL